MERASKQENRSDPSVSEVFPLLHWVRFEDSLHRETGPFMTKWSFPLLGKSTFKRSTVKYWETHG